MAAWLIGFLSERSVRLSVWKLTVYHVLGGMLLIYAGGVFWLVTGVGLGWKEALLTESIALHRRRFDQGGRRRFCLLRDLPGVSDSSVPGKALL